MNMVQGCFRRICIVGSLAFHTTSIVSQLITDVTKHQPRVTPISQQQSHMSQQLRLSQHKNISVTVS